MDEFTLIKTLFQPLQELGQEENASSSFLKKIGDDAAVWKGQGNLAFSIDTLVEGVHFTPDIPPEDLGYRCLAVNLSDLAAMSAVPLFYTLAITLPKVDSVWLTDFVSGMKTLAQDYQIPLVGGDTTKGPLTITIQAHGSCPKPVYRDGAKVEDDVYVSGTLGDAAGGLALWLDKSEWIHDDSYRYLIQRFHRPTPRINLGCSLSDVAHAMLDVSDGLLADLTHIAHASDVSIVVNASALPISDSLRACFSEQQALEWALSGGDDYELAFTAPKAARAKLQALSRALNVPISRIGRVTASKDGALDGCSRVRVENASVDVTRPGYNHFSST